MFIENVLRKEANKLNFKLLIGKLLSSILLWCCLEKVKQKQIYCCVKLSVDSQQYRNTTIARKLFTKNMLVLELVKIFTGSQDDFHPPIFSIRHLKRIDHFDHKNRLIYKNEKKIKTFALKFGLPLLKIAWCSKELVKVLGGFHFQVTATPSLTAECESLIVGASYYPSMQSSELD